MHKIHLVAIVLLMLFYHPKAYAINLLIGASIGKRYFTVSDEESQKDIAEFETKDWQYSPNISLKLEPSYFWENSNVAYTFSADFFMSRIKEQLLSKNDEEPQDVGTEIKGFSMFVTPIIYYHFNRDNTEGWQYHAGMGMGIGYQNHNGAFLITNANDPNFGKVEKINHAELGYTIGLYLEAIYQKHHIMLTSDLIAVHPSGTPYMYMEDNVFFKYQYQVYSFSLD
jgi:hypothetical protein